MNEAFNDYIFHYNPYSRVWSAVKREYSNAYFNGEDIPEGGIHRSEDLKILTHYIN
jgi:hypothetical protein